MAGWKSALHNMLGLAHEERQTTQKELNQKQLRLKKFFTSTREAFEELKVELEKTGRRVQVTTIKHACTIDIFHQGREFQHMVVCQHRATSPSNDAYAACKSSSKWRNKADPRFSIQRYAYGKIDVLQKDTIIQDFLTGYKKQLNAEAALQIKKQNLFKIRFWSQHRQMSVRAGQPNEPWFSGVLFPTTNSTRERKSS